MGFWDRCWEYDGWRHAKGYGVAKVDGRHVYVHRGAYEELIQPIPEDRPQLDHVCENEACYNPLHLEPVDNNENQRRKNLAIRKKEASGSQDFSRNPIAMVRL